MTHLYIGCGAGEIEATTCAPSDTPKGLGRGYSLTASVLWFPPSPRRPGAR